MQPEHSRLYTVQGFELFTRFDTNVLDSGA
jgi:hypothetical protein